MKNGFTLVELSIVLVIIGLLIGGILVGQSLIDSAKINQAVRQIQQYDIATSSFQDRFRQLPGDSSLMTPAGNNDGDAADLTGETSCGDSNCLEYFSFWKHLTDSRVIEGSYSNDYSSGGVPELNSPAFLDSEYGLNITLLSSDFGHDGSKGWNYEASDSLKGVTVFSIDSKIDDGDASTGFVRGNLFQSEVCQIDHEYCSILIAIMSTTGNPLNN